MGVVLLEHDVPVPVPQFFGTFPEHVLFLEKGTRTGTCSFFPTRTECSSNVLFVQFGLIIIFIIINMRKIPKKCLKNLISAEKFTNICIYLEKCIICIYVKISKNMQNKTGIFGIRKSRNVKI